MRKWQIFSGCVFSNSSALELVSPFLPLSMLTCTCTCVRYCSISTIFLSAEQLSSPYRYVSAISNKGQ